MRVQLPLAPIGGTEKRHLVKTDIGVNPAGDAGDVSPVPTNILVGGDINGNVPTNIWDGNVVEYELLIASVKRKQR